jgi:hypothetical protein
MIFNKVFQIGLDIRRIDLYTNPDSNIMNLLIDRLEKTNYKSCYIRKILRIVRRGECVIDQDSLDAGGKVSVQFEAEVEVFLRGEIITGAVVRAKNPHGQVICEKNNLTASFTQTPLYASIAEGQMVCIRVIDCKYTIGLPRVSMVATPLTHQQNTIYRIADPLTPADIEYMGMLIDTARIEEEKFATVDAGLKKQFIELLYAMKVRVPASTDSGDITTINIMDLKTATTISNVYVVRDYRGDLTTPTAYTWRDIQTANTLYPNIHVETNMPTRGVFVALISNYINYMQMIREMCETYCTPEIMESHQNLWRIFKKMKVDAVGVVDV